MAWSSDRRLASLALVFGASALAAPPQYNATDITNWSAAQKETLPFFKHYFPLSVPNAPVDFHAVSRSASGLVVGSTFNVFTGPDQRGVVISPSAVTIIDSFGDFHWWRTSPPASATFRVTNAFDVNWSGEVVGLANLPGTSQTSSQTPFLHPILWDAVNGKADLVPDAQSGSATCINNRGEIAGYAYGGTSPIQTSFRRSPDGAFTTLDPVPPGYMPQPLWINAEGIVIGTSVPGGWASAAGSTVFPLPKLFGMPLATPTDINDAGWIVGISEQWDHTEQYATLWEPNTSGTWTARDLTEQLNTPNILLDRALAIDNSGHIIAVGHLDGNGSPAYALYLLTATSAAANSCVPDLGRHPSNAFVCPGSVTLSVAVVNPNASTTYAWSKDGEPIAASANPSAITASLVIASASTTDSGVYECIVSNSCGSTTSNAALLDIQTCSPADLDSDGDFANGLSPDGGVDINDLLAFLSGFELGNIAVDLDNGSGNGVPDQGVDINDLLFFLAHFEQGC